MDFDPPLEQGTLIRRYKRFLADVRLPGGAQITVHCPNSGSMKGCSDPGSPIRYSRSDNPGRKYPHTLEMVRSGATWIGVNTSRTNRIVAEAIEKGQIKELTAFAAIRKEVKTSEGSRLDLLLEDADTQTYIEVKNCSLAEHGVALFPDAVTKRGSKHLRELERLVGNGARGVIFFLVQRLDCDSFSPAGAIDHEYAATLAEVHRKGVEILAYQAEVTPQSIEIKRALPVTLDG